MKKALLTTLAFVFSTLLFAEVSQQEKEALLDFYIVTDGENWNQTWDLTEPVSTWQGITVEDNKVVGISLLFNNVTGVLPHTLADLVHLRVLELSFNKLRGSIPSEIGELSNLQKLALNGNNLTGSIPASLSNLKNLKELHVSSNKLGGTLPVEIGNLPALEVFNVFDNQLSGVLPTQLAANRNLRELIVAENNFTNSDDFSIVLISNSASINFDQQVLSPNTKSVIAIETPDDN